MRKENLIAYATSFISFLLDEPISNKIEKIILFGSIARGNFDKESDIDLFIDTKGDIEKEIFKVLNLFKESETHKKWLLKGLENEISLKIGNLNKWQLKRDILTDGIMLYGKFKELPENLEYYLLLSLSFKNFKKVHQVKLWRKLYGYRQKVGNKVYETVGLIKELNGSRIESSIIIPIKNKKELLSFLNKEKIIYKLSEIWSDTL